LTGQLFNSTAQANSRAREPLILCFQNEYYGKYAFKFSKDNRSHDLFIADAHSWVTLKGNLSKYQILEIKIISYKDYQKFNSKNLSANNKLCKLEFEETDKYPSFGQPSHLYLNLTIYNITSSSEILILEINIGRPPNVGYGYFSLALILYSISSLPFLLINYLQKKKINF